MSLESHSSIQSQFETNVGDLKIFFRRSIGCQNAKEGCSGTLSVLIRSFVNFQIKRAGCIGFDPDRPMVDDLSESGCSSSNRKTRFRIVEHLWFKTILPTV